MTEAGHLDIGPLRLALRLGATGTVRYSASAYGGFFSSGPDSAFPAPLCRLSVDIIRRPVSIPPGEPLWRAGQHWAVWTAGADLDFRVGLNLGAQARQGCRVAHDLSRAEIALNPEWEGTDSAIVESPLRYPLDQILSWGLLSRIGGALLHAAVAVRDGIGWVFAGHSGAGKSTLSGLCHAAGWRILNDDRVLIYPRAGEWRVAGTPWHGTGRFAEAADFPLGGLFLLQQSKSDRVEPIADSQARLDLLDVAAVPWFEDTWSQNILDGLDRLVREIPVQRFHFTKTSAAVQALVDYQGLRAGVCA